MTRDPARIHYAAMQGSAREAVATIRAAWRQLDGARAAASFADIVAPAFVAAVSQAQAETAALATPYVAAVAGEQTAVINPQAFTGYTSEGMPLEWLAQMSAYRLNADYVAGAQPSLALARGLNRTALYAYSEVADAARSAVQTQITSDPTVYGHERVVGLPACDRCVVLAGAFYRYSTGFARHPNCDCTMRPVTRQQWRTESPDNSPDTLFASMTREEQDRRFGAGNAEAIRQGANLSQVVNASNQAMTVAGRRWTTSGTTVRGLYGGYRAEATRKVAGRRYRVATAPRPTAAELMEIARQEHMSRSELVRLFYRYAYIV